MFEPVFEAPCVHRTQIALTDLEERSADHWRKVPERCKRFKVGNQLSFFPLIQSARASRLCSQGLIDQNGTKVSETVDRMRIHVADQVVEGLVETRILQWGGKDPFVDGPSQCPEESNLTSMILGIQCEFSDVFKIMKKKGLSIGLVKNWRSCFWKIENQRDGTFAMTLQLKHVPGFGKVGVKTGVEVPLEPANECLGGAFRHFQVVVGGQKSGQIMRARWASQIKDQGPDAFRCAGRIVSPFS